MKSKKSLERVWLLIMLKSLFLNPNFHQNSHAISPKLFNHFQVPNLHCGLCVEKLCGFSHHLSRFDISFWLYDCRFCQSLLLGHRTQIILNVIGDFNILKENIFNRDSLRHIFENLTFDFWYDGKSITKDYVQRMYSDNVPESRSY